MCWWADLTVSAWSGYFKTSGDWLETGMIRRRDKVMRWHQKAACFVAWITAYYWLTWDWFVIYVIRVAVLKTPWRWDWWNSTLAVLWWIRWKDVKNWTWCSTSWFSCDSGLWGLVWGASLSQMTVGQVVCPWRSLRHERILIIGKTQRNRRRHWWQAGLSTPG